MDLAVIRLERARTENRGYRQQFTMGDSPVAISGLQALVQSLTILMLTRPGSDALAQEDGVDLLGIVQSAAQSFEDQRADAVMAYSLLQEQMIEMQANQEMPDSERLQRLEVVRIYPEGERFVHVLRVTSIAGETVTIDTKDIFLE